MADNYLEKQYEEYEAKKAAWEKVCKLGKRKRTSTTLSDSKQLHQPVSKTNTK
ncbi:MAG: hypothetical protein LKI39_14850 [Bacteroides sp.]|jgi:benzoyl-CoA reductase/2-hydroxyglutaryl-CoA dehydratase subunit BcrC/BadD/HgdB|nr:hypothetical protein [Bacteroides sp.]MCI1683810.1 hypothetical protein [Bacteroides sp.]